MVNRLYIVHTEIWSIESEVKCPPPPLGLRTPSSSPVTSPNSILTTNNKHQGLNCTIIIDYFIIPISVFLLSVHAPPSCWFRILDMHLHRSSKSNIIFGSLAENVPFHWCSCGSFEPSSVRFGENSISSLFNIPLWNELCDVVVNNLIHSIILCVLRTISTLSHRKYSCPTVGGVPGSNFLHYHCYGVPQFRQRMCSDRVLYCRLLVSILYL